MKNWLHVISTKLAVLRGYALLGEESLIVIVVVTEHGEQATNLAELNLLAQDLAERLDNVNSEDGNLQLKQEIVELFALVTNAYRVF